MKGKKRNRVGRQKMLIISKLCTFTQLDGEKNLKNFQTDLFKLLKNENDA